MITLLFLALSLVSYHGTLRADHYQDIERYVRTQRFPRAIAYCSGHSSTPQVQRFNRYLELILRKAAMGQFNLQYYKLHESNILNLLTLEEFYYVTYGIWPHMRELNKNSINKTEVIDYYNELFLMLERDVDNYYDQGALYAKGLTRALSLLGSKFQHFYEHHHNDLDQEAIFLKRVIERITLKIMARWHQSHLLIFSKADLYFIIFGKILIGDPGYTTWTHERLSKLYNEHHAKLQQKVIACTTSHNHPTPGVTP